MRVTGGSIPKRRVQPFNKKKKKKKDTSGGPMKAHRGVKKTRKNPKTREGRSPGRWKSPKHRLVRDRRITERTTALRFQDLGKTVHTGNFNRKGIFNDSGKKKSLETTGKKEKPEPLTGGDQRRGGSSQSKTRP